ncbi:aldo/keto reductase [Desulfuribacillus stibiiarsenatis]|nr:aldo/keto reductase [Desulfuribacillus stibiiarsenatis]
MCLGTLTMGPLQKQLSIDKGAELIVEAVKLGVNILDTAELYQTYPYIKKAISMIPKEHKPLIISKSYAYTKEMMKQSIERAISEMDTDHVDVFLMHEQETELTIRGHMEAYEYLLEAKQQKIIHAVGISCHSIEAVRCATNLEGVDCIMPIYNQKGIGIIDGTLDEMTKAISGAHSKGIGIIGMKALAGGHLLGNARQALDFALSCDTLDTIAIGVQSYEELLFNVTCFQQAPINPELAAKVQAQPRKLWIEEWCEGCGKCVQRCTANALMIVNDQVVVDHSKCRLCGYCGSVCPGFFIKVV